jgi:FkbM family methyltransferase
MQQFDQWWFPDGEVQLPQEMTKHDVRVEGRLTWQYHKYAAALALLPVDRRRCAVDVGAHVGLWSYFMQRDFGELHAFEPNIEAGKCWIRNLPPIGDVTLHACALGDHRATVTLDMVVGESGGAHVVLVDHGTIEQHTLDSYHLPVIDLLKIDVEGYEAAVIEGARETIARCRPIIVVEDVARNNARYDFAPVSVLLESLGMRRRAVLGSDAIWEW